MAAPRTTCSSSSSSSSKAEIAAAKAALAPNHPPSAWRLENDNDDDDDPRTTTTAAAASVIVHEPGTASVTVNGHTFVDTTVRLPMADFCEAPHPYGDRLPCEPAVLSGGCQDWAAYKHASPDTQRWSLANLVARLDPATRLSVDGGPSFARQSINAGGVSMAAYEHYCKPGSGGAAQDLAPLYLFDPDVLKSTFANGRAVCDDFCIPPCFALDTMAGLTGSRFRPLPPAWLLVGATRSGTPIHEHPFFTAWNALLVGCKLWCCLPPDVDESVLLLLHGSDAEKEDLDEHENDDDEFDFDSSALEWFSQCCRDGKRLPDSARILVQQPGEVVYVPPGWWHVVLNVETSTAICYSLTLARDIPRLFPPLYESDESFACAWLASLGKETEEASSSPRVAQALFDLAVVYDSSIRSDEGNDDNNNNSKRWDNPEMAASCYARSAALFSSLATNAAAAATTVLVDA
jgi:histone arginine demethylase JMJD6